MGAIDVHTHAVPRGWPDLGEGKPWLRVESEREAVIMIRSAQFRRIGSECWDPEIRLRDMAADGIDLQVVSPTPVFFSYDTPAREGERISRIFNDLALEMCTGPRLVPFCQVPLQDPDAACRELERAVASGHRGVEIGNHVGDRDLDDAGIVTFLQHAASLDVPVFVHPWDMPESPRLDRWMARWLTGMPAETHLSIIAMILGGVFDRVPPSLRMCFAHGGGSFAFWLGRFENAWHQRSDTIAKSALPPSQYVDRFSVDSVVFSPVALRALVDSLGAQQVMVGSDYPYPLGERPAGAVVRSADFLSPQDADAILSGNARRFLGAATVDPMLGRSESPPAV
ncbi:amidohydrolase family protein [Amycolatopsis jejuensis]|uniref:amidohydrolase family protein n=1 Tax=Amycolatopsis jejuensis TaxID=330084 RepID=UPI00068EFAF0|nr:amidohydrolase family protein [Amycolatopsis jejuensis]